MGYSYDSAGNPISQPATYAERVANARKTIEEAELIMPVLIDEIENPLWCSYGRLPNNAYLISTTGEVLVYQKWNDPGEMEKKFPSASQFGLPDEFDLYAPLPD